MHSKYSINTYLASLQIVSLPSVKIRQPNKCKAFNKSIVRCLKWIVTSELQKHDGSSEINPSAWFDIKQNLQETWCFKWKQNCLFEYFICRNDFVRVLKWLPGTLEHFAFSCLFFPAIPHRRSSSPPGRSNIHNFPPPYTPNYRRHNWHRNLQDCKSS